jgi:hypothetical protein
MSESIDSADLIGPNFSPKEGKEVVAYVALAGATGAAAGSYIADACGIENKKVVTGITALASMAVASVALAVTQDK